MCLDKYDQYVFDSKVRQEAKYTAIDVAKYIITYCKKKNAPITNLKLQYLLYYLWKEAYYLTKTFLFSDKFIPVLFGPRLNEVYYEFAIYAGNSIYMEFDVFIEDFDRIFIESFLDKYMNVQVSTFSSRIRKEGSPWDIVWKNKDTYIPFLSIAASEVEDVNINNIVEESIGKMREIVEYFLENTKKI